MPSLLDILGYAGNLLDLPGSSVRDLLSGNNPFDQWATPFSSDNRASGRDVLRPFLGENEETGMSGWLQNPMEGVKDIAGFGLEMAADPLNFVSLSPLWRALKGRKAVKGANAAQELANRGRYGYVNAKLLADDMLGGTDEAVASVKQMDTVPELMIPGAKQQFDNEYAKYWASPDERSYDPGTQTYSFDDFKGSPPPGQKLLGYTIAPENPMFPGREIMYHGTGYDWTKTPTAEHPFGMYDTRYIGKGEGNQMYGPGFYKAGDKRTSNEYADYVVGKARQQAKLPSQEFASTFANLTRDMEGSHDVLAGMLDRYFTDPAHRLMPDTRELYRVLKENDFLGMDLADPFTVEEFAGALSTPKGLENFFGSENAKLLRPFTDEAHGISKKVYTLDVPAGTKERYLRWENPLSDQPPAVQNMPEVKAFAADLAETQPMVQKMVDLQKEYIALEKEFETKLKESGVGLNWKKDPALVSLDAKLGWNLKQESDIRDVLKTKNVPVQTWWKPQDAEGYLNPTGETLADHLMGTQTSKARFEDVTGLKEAGVPGITNPARIVGDSRNYVTWDTDLIGQFRLREVDGVRYPINPMFGPVKAEQRVIPQIADSPLTEVVNPMSTQPLPGLAKPVMQGAAYQALARFNTYGGSL